MEIKNKPPAWEGIPEESFYQFVKQMKKKNPKAFKGNKGKRKKGFC